MLALQTVLSCALLWVIAASSSIVAPTRALAATTRSVWLAEAENHVQRMNELLYPGTKADLKARMHAVREHPVYNFLHTYYRYSAEDLKMFSPGLDRVLSFNDDDGDLAKVHSRFRVISASQTLKFEITAPLTADGRFGWIQLSRARDILRATSTRLPFLGCFGLHEWAMLYKQNQKKQPFLKLRVSQSTINEMVESGVKCTHFDAFRFFHVDAQPLNTEELSRDTQDAYEQPGCIHATMDLFKYAFSVYPLASSELLRQSLELAIMARKIDMRASPYDVSHICELPIAIETPEGRIQYAAEQLQLAELAAPIRQRLLSVYDQILPPSTLQGKGKAMAVFKSS